MPGQGEFVLTGQMGDVMKESAQIGISYIRSIAENYQIDAEFLKTMTYISIFRKERFQRMVHQPELPWRQQCFLQLQKFR